MVALPPASKVYSLHQQEVDASTEKVFKKLVYNQSYELTTAQDVEYMAL